MKKYKITATIISIAIITSIATSVYQISRIVKSPQQAIEIANQYTKERYKDYIQHAEVKNGVWVVTYYKKEVTQFGGSPTVLLRITDGQIIDEFISK